MIRSNDFLFGPILWFELGTVGIVRQDQRLIFLSYLLFKKIWEGLLKIMSY